MNVNTSLSATRTVLMGGGNFTVNNHSHIRSHGPEKGSWLLFSDYLNINKY